MTKYIHYNKTNTCNRCIEKLKPCYVYREYDKEGNWTGKWLCQSCYKKEQYKNGNTNANIINLLRDRRIGNLKPNSNQAKGDLSEELTCIWRGVENLNVKNDNYNSPIDHSIDSELGIIETKGRLYDYRERRWGFASLEKEWDKKFDHMICYCASRDGKIIERIYIFPKPEIIGKTSISIYKNLIYKRYGWYEEYRVKDKDELKKVNEIWKKIIDNRV